MKKILAVILTIVMLLGIAVFNSSADTTDVPASVTLVTNSGSPLDVEGKVAQDGSKYIFTVRFDRFILIRGIDITIDAGEAIITDVETFNLPTAVDGRDEFDENWRYVRGKSSIRFVDLNITSKSRIVLSVQDPSIAPISDDGEAVSLTDGKFGTQKITVTGKYADTGETLVPITTKPQDYEIMEYVEAINASTGTIEQPTEKDKNGVGYFIPFGGIYKENGNDITYTKKETNGQFLDVPAGSKLLKFPLPRYEEGKDGTVINQLTTFGISEPKEVGEDPWENDADGIGIIKIGSYTTYDDFNTSKYEITDKNGSTTKVETRNLHGTLVFDGDWLSLKHYYIKQGNTVQQFVRAIFKQMTELEQSQNVDTNIVDNPNTKFHVTYEVPKWDSDDPNEKVHVRVYKFPRVKYMWRDDTDGKGNMEYAVRLHNAESNQTYTGVGYCLEYNENYDGGYDLDQVQISYNVKSFGTVAHSNNTNTAVDTPNS